MPLVLADRVRETTTTTGTGTISLAGPVSGFQGFSTAIGNANTTYYTIVDSVTGAWEVGLGTYTSSGSTLARTTVLSSSNSDALVPFGVGTKDVFVTQPAERAVYILGAGTGLAAGAAAFTANGIPYASATNTLTTGSNLTYTEGGSNQLTVTSASASYFTATVGANTSYFGTNGTGTYVGSGTNVPVVFYQNNTEGMRLTSSGLSLTANPTLSGGTANGVAYLNASKVLTTGSALTFDGAQLSVNGVTVGRGAGAVATNTAVGASALAANTTGAQNTAFGESALSSVTTAVSNTAVGQWALKLNTGNSNTGIGQNSLGNNTTGTDNVAVGTASLFTNDSGVSNVAVGRSALRLNTTGSYNTVLGMDALRSNTTASNNTAVGYQAGYSNTTGTANNTVGYQSLYSNQTGSNNTAFGYFSLRANTTDNNTAFGHYALSSNTAGTSNTAMSLGALLSNTTGNYNTGIGFQSLSANTTASNNTAVGYQAGYSNTTASNNTAIGYQAGHLNTVGTGNVYFGWLAGYAATSSTNTFIGSQSGYNNTTGERNTYIGNSAGFNATTGSNNTFIGLSAISASGAAITTGSKNTIIGGYNGNQGGLDIRTANNYIVLSDGDGNPRGIFDGSGNLRIGVVAAAYNAERLSVFKGGNAEAAAFTNDAGANNYTVAVSNRATTGDNKFMVFATESSDTTRGSIVYNRGTGQVVYSATSDYRAKDIIGPVQNSGATIDALKVYEGKMKGATQSRPMLVAHEAQAVAPYCVIGEKDAVDAEGEPVYQQMDVSSLVPLLLAELQSLRARVAQLETKGA